MRSLEPLYLCSGTLHGFQTPVINFSNLNKIKRFFFSPLCWRSKKCSHWNNYIYRDMLWNASKILNSSNLFYQSEKIKRLYIFIFFPSLFRHFSRLHQWVQDLFASYGLFQIKRLNQNLNQICFLLTGNPIGTPRRRCAYS